VTVASAPDATRSVVTKSLRALIHAYQAATSNRSPACRFVPSCSEYALEALQVFGARRGVPLAVRRLVRCRPGGPFGFDPVPGDTLLLPGDEGRA
jgi:putative membrane protein insertion efficiency factor